MSTDAFLESVRQDLTAALDTLAARGAFVPGRVLVLGCSSSEIAGERIGKGSSQAVGDTVVDTILNYIQPLGVELVIGCCEHLNRALVCPRALAEKKGWQIVMAKPALHAGGACGVAYYARLSDPCMVETAQADCGLDVGHTMIGMHLKRVAVPVRGDIDHVGKAPLVMAVTRPPYIGGPRAEYPELN